MIPSYFSCEITGEIAERYEDEDFKVITYFDDEKEIAKEYIDEEGKTKVVGNIPDGVAKLYRDFGRPMVEFTFLNNKRNGVSTYYYSRKHIQLGIVETYKDGILEGPYKTYYSNGILEEEGVYKNGKCASFKAYEYYGTPILQNIGDKNSNEKKGIEKKRRSNEYVQAIKINDLKVNIAMETARNEWKLRNSKMSSMMKLYVKNKDRFHGRKYYSPSIEVEPRDEDINTANEWFLPITATMPSDFNEELQQISLNKIKSYQINTSKLYVLLFDYNDKYSTGDKARNWGFTRLFMFLNVNNEMRFLLSSIGKEHEYNTAYRYYYSVYKLGKEGPNLIEYFANHHYPDDIHKLYWINRDFKLIELPLDIKYIDLDNDGQEEIVKRYSCSQEYNNISVSCDKTEILKYIGTELEIVGEYYEEQR